MVIFTPIWKVTWMQWMNVLLQSHLLLKKLEISVNGLLLLRLYRKFSFILKTSGTRETSRVHCKNDNFMWARASLLQLSRSSGELQAIFDKLAANQIWSVIVNEWINRFWVKLISHFWHRNKYPNYDKCSTAMHWHLAGAVNIHINTMCGRSDYSFSDQTTSVMWLHWSSSSSVAGFWSTVLWERFAVWSDIIVNVEITSANLL